MILIQTLFTQHAFKLHLIMHTLGIKPVTYIASYRMSKCQCNFYLIIFRLIFLAKVSISYHFDLIARPEETFDILNLRIFYPFECSLVPFEYDLIFFD